ncbi:MAG: hypothetical protein ACK5TM_14000, partial [Methylobacterium sp.]
PEASLCAFNHSATCPSACAHQAHAFLSKDRCDARGIAVRLQPLGHLSVRLRPSGAGISFRSEAKGIL